MSSARRQVYISISIAKTRLLRLFMLEYFVMTTPPRMRAAGPVPRVRNPRTQAQIRRDLIWQIAVPLGLAVAAALVLMVLIAAPVGAPVRSAWADVSLIFLIIPTALFGLVLLALTGGLIYAAWYGLRELPYLFKRIQDFAAVASYRVQTAADKASGVFLSIRSIAAGARRAAAGVRQTLGIGGKADGA
jgi:hypothetical protein